MSWYPGWDSLDSVKTWHTVFEISGIVILALLVGAEVLAFQYGHRKDELTAIAERSAEIERQRDADTADKRRREDVERVEKKLAEANEKVAELDRLRTPRQLTKAQAEVVGGLLADAPKLQLVIKAGTSGGDEAAYAEEIASVFRRLSWSVRVDNAIFMGTDVSGMWLAVGGKAGEPVPEPVNRLIRTLASAGLDIRGQVTAEAAIPEQEVWLSIGRKK